MDRKGCESNSQGTYQSYGKSPSPSVFSFGPLAIDIGYSSILVTNLISRFFYAWRYNSSDLKNGTCCSMSGGLAPTTSLSRVMVRDSRGDCDGTSELDRLFGADM